MNIGIIGAGFTGLSAAYQLTKKGHSVTIFEKDGAPGGLALGFQEPTWKWSLEKHYHHWFTNDTSVLNLAKEINYNVLIKTPKTSVYVDNELFQLDSPLHVLLFQKLTLSQRLRMASVLGFLRYNPYWQPLEKLKAAEFLPKTMGSHAYKKLWEPLLVSKFGAYSKDISLAWFWARIKKRTKSLAYPEGGFLQFAHTLTQKIEEQSGRVLFNTEVKEITSDRKGVKIKFQKMADGIHSTGHSTLRDKPSGSDSKNSGQEWKMEHFDKVIVTLPSFFFMKIAPSLPTFYKEQLSNLKGFGAINLVLRLNKPFFNDTTYWLSVCDRTSPIMAIVEHTNFMDKKQYNNEHLVYLGNYLPHDHKYFQMNEQQLLTIYDPFLRKINPTYRLSLIASHLFKAPFAQPIIPTNYSKIIPSFITPLKNVYLANIQQVYPWDRGTNYAVELGEKIAKLVTQ